MTMGDQLAWIVLAPDAAEATGAPGDPPATCPSCRLRPVAWRKKLKEWSRYCGLSNCTNHYRLCVWCDETYERSGSEAGTKYCSDRCKQAGYAAAHTRNMPARGTHSYPCARCGHEFRVYSERRDQICSPCRKAYAGQINAHNMPTDWALRLIMAVNCDICSRVLGTAKGKHLGKVDHDHSCCPGASSCGECIRGIICNACNMLAGFADADAERYAEVLRYVQEWRLGNAQE